MNKPKTLAVFCLLLLLFIQGCRYDRLDPAPVSVEDTCDQQLPVLVSFSNDIQPIFNRSCATAGCHSGDFPQSNFNLDPGISYAQLTKPGSGYINTAKPKQSILYRTMVSITNPMPPLGNLSPCEIKLVLKWIEQQAPNN